METTKKSNEIKRQNKKLEFAKKTLEKRFMENDKIVSTTKFCDVQKLYGQLDIFKLVPEIDLIEIYLACIMKITKREKRDSDLRSCFEMTVTYKTTWTEAQKILKKFPKFLENDDLVKMDKGEMLKVFTKFVKELEYKEKLASRDARRQRKNRDNFDTLLKNLNSQGVIHASSKWKEVVGVIKEKSEYEKMLGQPGSTPVDLFKYFVSELKETEKALEMKKIDGFESLDYEPMDIDEDVIENIRNLKMLQFDEIDHLAALFSNCNIRF